MSVTDSPGGRREASRFEHIAVIVGIWAALLGGVGALLSIWLPVAAWSGHVTASVFIGALFLTHQHELRLCVYCIRESPNDAAIRVQRKRHWLWAHHYLNLSVRFNRASLGLFLAVLVVAAILGWPLASTIATVCMTFMIAALWRAGWVHRGLVVWCPWCKGGGRKQGSPELVPSPTLAKSA